MNINQTDGLGVVSCPKQEFRGAVPEGDDDRIEIRKGFQWCIEESSEPQISWNEEWI